MRLAGTPARHVSTMAPTLVSRPRQRSMAAVANRAPLGFGMCGVTSPEVVVRLRSWRPAPTRSPASCSSRPLRVSSTVFLTSQLFSADRLFTPE